MRKFVLLLMLLISAKAYSAGPVTHAYIAEKWLQYNSQYNGQQTSDFFVGTLFPDIRYTAKIARDKTHFKGLTLNDVRHGKTSFWAGLNLHCYLDEAREKMVVENHVYDLFQDFVEAGDVPSLLKLLEDEILFSKIDKGQLLIYLKAIIEEEVQFGIDPYKIRSWHEFQLFLLTNPPSEILRALASINRPYLQIPAETVQLWNAHFAELVQNPEIQKHVRNLEEKFEQEFLQYALEN
jgi:hypothetical protein